MRIGELSKRSGLTRDAIRFYERAGLIKSLPGKEASNTYREYPEMLIEELQFISDARAAGLSIAELQEMNDGMHGSQDLDLCMSVLDDKIRKTKRTLKFLLDTRQQVLDHKANLE